MKPKLSQFADAVETTPLLVKQVHDTTQTVYTKQQLQEMTKYELIALADSTYGESMSLRILKSEMVRQLLALQETV